MAQRPGYFVVLANMRTGSNLLEESLNTFPGIVCHGEAFNPRFIGHAGVAEAHGVTLADRERDPMALIDRLRGATDGIAGFRLFPDHDDRVLAKCLGDRRCAKVVLARNPVDSYVSWKIARQTGQWWLGDLKSAKSAKAVFDADEFRVFLDRWQGFYGQVRETLQRNGQTAFHIHYDDLRDPEVIGGLVRFLIGKPVEPASGLRGKVQNPERLGEKVENFEEMEKALARADYFDLFRDPDFEPRRSANIPTYYASARAPLLFLPMPGGPTERIAAWMTSLDRAEPETGATQKSLRAWKRARPGHRSFTVVSHPLERAHRAFCRHVLDVGPDTFVEIRKTLATAYKVPLPEGSPDAGYDAAAHHAAFLAFLRFLKGNLSGQTSVRVPAVWASQAKILQGFADFMPPDAILREQDLAAELSRLAEAVGREAPSPDETAPETPFALADLYDSKLEAAARAAYQRDYMLFGFGPWR